jgi:hypothetical protein
MPIRAAVSDGPPVGKKLQTGIEVKKSVGLANIQTTRSGGAARQAEVKFSQRSLRGGAARRGHSNNFFTLPLPQQTRRGKILKIKKRQAFYRDA